MPDPADGHTPASRPGSGQPQGVPPAHTALPTASAGADAPADVTGLNAADASAVATLAAAGQLAAVHANESHWWNHASFALPLLGAIVCLIAGWALGVAELLGFGVFLAAVTLFMLPVVLLTWRSTPTAIVLTRDGAQALHDGRVLREVAWRDLAAIERVETMGNIRWKLRPRTGQHLSIEGEIADVPGLIATAYVLSGIPHSE